jgi:polyisoprenoid-binding protein YceI
MYKDHAMKLTTAFCSTASLVLLLGCSNPADNVPAASVSADTNAMEAAGGDARRTEESGEKVYAAGPSSGSIEFLGSKVTGSHKGGFKNFAAEFRAKGGKLVGSGNRVVIDMGSTWADNDRLTGHLKSPDFFNAAQFPTATFVSSAIEDKQTNTLVTGNLTLHGVTKQISFPAQVQVADDAVSVSANFVLNRFDFDIKYPGKANDLIRKEVVMKFNLKATPGKADFQSIEPAAKTVAAR